MTNAFSGSRALTEVAVDIGQTQARARVLSGSLKGREVQVAGFAYGSDLRAAIPAIATEVAQRLGASTVDTLAVGSTGLYGQVPPLDGVGRMLHERLGVTRVLVADDAVTAYLGAMGDAHGVVVAAGTGLVALGVGPAGAARVDGVGGMIGDEGAGWWIGRRGLIAAISAADGRPQASAGLLARLEARFGAVAEFPASLAGDPHPVAVVASFAKDVADAARDGDAIATAIWREAGGHIAGAVVAAARRSGLEGGLPWMLLGRLGAADDLLQAGWEPVLREALPSAVRIPSAGSPLDGAARLIGVDPTPFGPMVLELTV